MARKLYRSATNRKIWGVCGGLGEYFDVDANLVRAIFVVLALAKGLGILLYAVLTIVMPSGSVPVAVGPQLQKEEPESQPQALPRGPVLAGAILVAVGLIFLFSNLGWFWWLGWGTLWPLVLIAIGVILLLARWRR